MSVEVANLVSRFSVVVEGVEDSIRAARNFVDAAEQAGKVSSSTADRVNSLADSVERSVGSFQKGADALGGTIAKLQVMAGSVEEARTAVGEWSKNIDQARSDVENLVAAGEQIPQWLGDMAQGFVDTEAVIQHYVETYGMSEEAAQQYLEKVQELLDTFQQYGEQVAQQEKLAGQADRSQRRLATGVARARAEFDASGRPMRNFFRQLMNINNGSIFTAYGIASLIGRLTGLGLVATVVIRGFTNLARKFREGAAAVDAFLMADQGVADMVRDFEALGNVNLSQLVGQLDDLRIRLSNIGAVDPLATTQQVLEIAVDFQYLNATPDDLNQTVSELFRTVQSLDFSGLAGFDVGPGKIQELNYQFQQLASQGMSEAELRTRALIELQNILAERGGIAADRQAREAETLGSALKGMETAWQNATVNNEQFTKTVREMADFIQAAQPTLDALANFLAGAFSTGVRIATDVVDGLRLMFIDAGIWAASTAKKIAEFFSVGFADTSAFDEFIAQSEAAKDQIAILNQLRGGLAGSFGRGDAFGDSDLENFATALGNITQQGSLTLDFFDKLKRATGVSVRDAATMTKRLIDQADQFGFSADQVDVLRQGLAAFETQLSSTSNEVAGFGDSSVSALQALNTELDNVSSGKGVIDTIKNLGDASKALRENTNAKTVTDFFSAYEQALEVALNGGAQKLAAFRKFAEEQLKPQLSADEWRSMEELLSLSEDALASVAADAQKYADDASSAEAVNRTFTDSTVELGDAAIVTAGAIDTQREAIQRLVNDSPYTVDIITNMITTNQIATNIATEQPRPRRTERPRSGTGTRAQSDWETFEQNTRPIVGARIEDPGGAAARAQSRASNVEQRAADAAAAAAAADEAYAAHRAALSKALDEASTQAMNTGLTLQEEQALIEKRMQLNEDARNLRPGAEGVAALFPSGGGGGGGGSDLMNIEEIRRFMQEVNEAIAIAARGGVRIGTAGNAIPWEAGTFVNTQGNNIQIDTMLIRGVWDYTDPAAKREIVRQLQEALAELSGEI